MEDNAVDKFMWEGSREEVLASPKWKKKMRVDTTLD